VNVLIPDKLKLGQKLFGKLRSYGPTHPCEITEVCEDGFTVRFDESRFAPCPGQKLVVYNDTEDVVAGGTIEVFS
jgi:tRNA U34 2-thiouridine synthase MnmA/TrmU